MHNSKYTQPGVLPIFYGINEPQNGREPIFPSHGICRQGTGDTSEKQNSSQYPASAVSDTNSETHPLLEDTDRRSTPPPADTEEEKTEDTTTLGLVPEGKKSALTQESTTNESESRGYLSALESLFQPVTPTERPTMSGIRRIESYATAREQTGPDGVPEIHINLRGAEEELGPYTPGLIIDEENGPKLAELLGQGEIRDKRICFDCQVSLSGVKLKAEVHENGGRSIVFNGFVQTAMDGEGKGVHLEGCELRGGIRVWGDTLLHGCKLDFPEQNFEVSREVSREVQKMMVEIEKCEIRCQKASLRRTEMRESIIKCTYCFLHKSVVSWSEVTATVLWLSDGSEFGRGCALGSPNNRLPDILVNKGCKFYSDECSPVQN